MQKLDQSTSKSSYIPRTRSFSSLTSLSVRFSFPLRISCFSCGIFLPPFIIDFPHFFLRLRRRLFYFDCTSKRNGTEQIKIQLCLCTQICPNNIFIRILFSLALFFSLSISLCYCYFGTSKSCVVERNSNKNIDKKKSSEWSKKENHENYVEKLQQMTFLWWISVGAVLHKHCKLYDNMKN